MKYVVIGGAGAMGRITVKDLVETCPKDEGTEILIADYDLEKARVLSHIYCDPRVKAVQVDVKNTDQAVQTLAGSFVLINAAQYQLNLDVMEIALRLKCHYVDLGGLFHYTLKQLQLNDRFKAIDRTALLGMGAAPGITNILSRFGAAQPDTVA